MIVLENICKEYRKNNQKILALNHINLSFDCGNIYAILGPSGCGKTTLLNLIGMLDTATSGKIFIDNLLISKKILKETCTLRKDKIGFVFQDFFLNDKLTAFENVEIPLFLNKNMTQKQRKDRVDELLKDLNILHRKNHFPKELSGGEQQRVAIARALINDPKYILADEPTGNLDKKNEILIFEYLKNIAKQGKCVIVATHSQSILEYADVVIEIENGEIVKNEGF